MQKLSFEEFSKEIVNKIGEYIKGDFEIENIELTTILKNNDQKLTGIMIKERNVSIAPTIYLTSYYESYIDNVCEIEDILENIATLRKEKRTIKRCEFDLKNIEDFKSIKNKIYPKLINFEMNKKLLSNKVHTRLCDLAIVYYLDLGSIDDGFMTITITKDMFRLWNITEKELYNIALENLNNKYCPVKENIFNVIEHLIKDNDLYMLEAEKFNETKVYHQDNDILVLSQGNINGSVILLNDNYMQKIAQQFEEKNIEFLIIPSSIHEILIITGELAKDKLYVRKMVNDVNYSNVSTTEILSNQIYHYSNKGLEIA